MKDFRWRSSGRPYNLGMHSLVALITVGVALLLGACASEEKEWMKVDTKYTVAEFRRDYAACSKGGQLDEPCMRGKGWVAVSPGAGIAKPTEPQRPGAAHRHHQPVAGSAASDAAGSRRGTSW